MDRATLPRVCPRCRGSMIPETRDSRGDYSMCLSCGYVHEAAIISHAELEDEEYTDANGVRRRRRPQVPRHGGNPID